VAGVSERSYRLSVSGYLDLGLDKGALFSLFYKALMHLFADFWLAQDCINLAVVV